MRGFAGIKEVDWKSDEKFPIYFVKLGIISVYGAFSFHSLSYHLPTFLAISPTYFCPNLVRRK